MVTISPELIKKLSPKTQMHIERFFSSALELNKSIEECKIVSLDNAFHMRKNRDDAELLLTDDFNEGRITYDEETEIKDRISGFGNRKVIEFIEGLKKCGCKFKER